MMGTMQPRGRHIHRHVPHRSGFSGLFDRKKDVERNVARHARLGIPEYFLHDRARNQLFAYRLTSADATAYGPIVSQHGRYESRVLGWKSGSRRTAGTAMLLESDELIVRLEQMVEQVQQRAGEEALRREERSAKARVMRGSASPSTSCIRAGDGLIWHFSALQSNAP